MELAEPPWGVGQGGRAKGAGGRNGHIITLNFEKCIEHKGEMW